MSPKQRYKRSKGFFFAFLILSLSSTACSLVERTPNQAFVNDFLNQIHSDPSTAYNDLTSDAFKSAVGSEDFLSLAEESFSNFSAYTSYVQTLDVLSFDIQLGTSEVEDYGDFTLSTGELVPVVVYLELTDGDLKLTGIYTIASWVRDELAGKLNSETGYVDYSLDGFNYNSEDREITSSATFVDQNGSEVTKETRYLFSTGELQGWVVDPE